MRGTALALGVAALLLGCGSEADRQKGEARQPSSQDTRMPVLVIVTRDDPSLSAGCRPREVLELVNEFLYAVNTGKASAANFFAFDAAPGGGWFSLDEGDPEGKRRHFTARNRAQLKRYFAERERHHDHLRLLEVRVNGERQGLGQIEYRLKREADDLGSLGITTNLAFGKGAVACHRHKLAIWSMAMPAGDIPRGHDAPLCPPAQVRKPVTVACASR